MGSYVKVYTVMDLYSSVDREGVKEGYIESWSVRELNRSVDSYGVIQ